MFLAARRVSLCVLFLVPLFTAKLKSFEIFFAQSFEKSSKFVCLDHHFRRFGQRITRNNVSRAFSATISVPASFAVPASQSSSSSSSASPVAVATAAGALGANERAFQRFGYRYQLLSFVYVLLLPFETIDNKNNTKRESNCCLHRHLYRRRLFVFHARADDTEDDDEIQISALFALLFTLTSFHIRWKR